MRRQQEIKRYAKMFLNATGLEGAPEALSELMFIKSLIIKSVEFMSLLENPLFTVAERGIAVKGLSQRLKLSDSTVSLILYLSERRIISMLPELIHTATALYLEKKKMAKAVVTTPSVVDKKHEERLRASLKSITGLDMDIEYIIDPSIIGGMMVRVGSTMYDSSIKGQLRLLKDDIMKG